MSNWNPRKGDAVTVDLNYISPEEAKQLRRDHFPQAHYVPVLVKATYIEHELKGWKHDSFYDLVRFENGTEEWVSPNAVSEPLEQYQPDLSLLRVVQGKPPKSWTTPPSASVKALVQSNNEFQKIFDALSKRKKDAAKTMFGDPPPDLPS